LLVGLLALADAEPLAAGLDAEVEVDAADLALEHDPPEALRRGGQRQRLAPPRLELARERRRVGRRAVGRGERGEGEQGRAGARRARVHGASGRDDGPWYGKPGTRAKRSPAGSNALALVARAG